MDAVILAGGFGKRLRPITDYVPKPLVPIDNVPIIEWQIRYLKKSGVKNITVCTGHRTEQVEGFLKSKSNFGVRVRVSAERKPLGTGGAIKNAAEHIGGRTFFVMNGDTITNISLKTMQKTENSVAGIELKTRFGTLNISENRISAFEEKKPIKDVWMNAGIYHLSRDVLGQLPARGDIEKTTFPRMARQGRLYVTKFRNVEWFSIDTHKDIEECSKVVKSVVK